MVSNDSDSDFAVLERCESPKVQKRPAGPHPVELNQPTFMPNTKRLVEMLLSMAKASRRSLCCEIRCGTHSRDRCVCLPLQSESGHSASLVNHDYYDTVSVRVPKRRRKLETSNRMVSDWVALNSRIFFSPCSIARNGSRRARESRGTDGQFQD
jgi:hypothetical protein